MTGNEIRSKFLDFFKRNGHTIKSSASLVPSDPTVLFSIAGMVQFKKMFLGEVPLEFTRAATSQKCIRTNDLDNVGKTARHHTFFEMLGNFSFGDYFKDDAIKWGWEFLTRDMKLPVDKLYITIYKNDDESFEIWHKKIGLPKNRIIRMGEETNFWTMGDTGPCGPCSEILFDLGPEFGCNKPGCAVGCDCDRYLELWNLVFTQYDRQKDGQLSNLPKKNIDTGMGLERLARVIQKANNNYETDLILPIITKISNETGIEYGKSNETDVYLKIIADHIRAITFLIADGVIPSNEERGYVLRRIIRRAVVHGKLLGYEKLFLHNLSNTVIDIMNSGYPELNERKKYINNIILVEEENFIKTLERAQATFEEIIEKVKKSGTNTISGEDAFILSDTYGLPISITETLAQKHNVKIDLDSYEKFLNVQQSRSRENWHKKLASGDDLITNLNLSETIFTGYSALKSNAKILYISENTNPDAKENSKISIILDTTPFYAESGGQSGDIGILAKGNDKFLIENTIKQGSYHIHIGKIVSGNFSQGDVVEAVVNESNRKNTARNHSATHILQAILRRVLGSHVTQAGSLVSSDYLRFDFTHFSTLSKSELMHIEELVNENIFINHPVNIEIKNIKDAKKEGAMALFGEKYGDEVRMVSMGNISKELCGGTHISGTGEIGLFKILREESVGSGIRRIEAITAGKVLEYINKQDAMVDELCAITKSSPEILKEKIIKLQENLKNLEKEKEKINSKLANDSIDSIINQKLVIKDINIISGILPDTKIESLRSTIDILKNKFEKGVFIFGSTPGEKPTLIVGVTKNLTPNIHAGKLIKEASAIIGGKGGGRPDLAEAGGTDSFKLNDSISYIIKTVKELLGS